MKNPTRNFGLRAFAALVVCILAGTSLAAAERTSRPNILFISLDDFGPYLKAYGRDQVIAPNMDRLARQGTVFERAYCQMAICSPSRSSLMTGLRPDSTGVFDLATHFRAKVPDVVTLPQHFKNNGYHTQAVGKNFHPAFSFHADVDGQKNLDDPPSWSAPLWLPSPPRYYHTPEGIEDAKKVFVRTRMKASETPDDWYKYVIRGFAVEAPDVPDETLYDGQVTKRAIDVMRQLAAAQKAAPTGEMQPFFLGVGFLKPHYPFIAPKKYWDLYKREDFAVAENNFPPHGIPPIALQVHWNEARAQSDVPKVDSILPEQQREMKHGYHACISYVDALVGRLLTELERLRLRENTIIVLWGDHGFSLGENSMWGKLTNLERSTRSPLMVVMPDGRFAGQRTRALVEFVDIYPSLCDLAGLPLPDHLEGTSFMPLLENPDRAWKTAAFSQYLRPGFPNYRTHPLAINTPESFRSYPKTATMGYSMRTDRYRFGLWIPVAKPEEVIGVELYDHVADPAENVNIATRPENAELVAELTQRLRRGWRGELPPR